MPKLMKTHPIDEVVTLIDLYLEVDQDIEDMSVELQALFHQLNFIVLALDFKRPLREELAEWLNAPLPDPEEYRPTEVEE